MTLALLAGMWEIALSMWITYLLRIVEIAKGASPTIVRDAGFFGTNNDFNETNLKRDGLLYELELEFRVRVELKFRVRVGISSSSWFKLFCFV